MEHTRTVPVIKRGSRIAPILLTLLIFSQAALLQAARDRITAKIDNAKRVRLSGHLHPEAVADNDLGAMDSAVVLSNLTLSLKPSADQEKALDALIESQQDPSSPNYHKWVSPAQYADRFGASVDDIEKVKAWLEQQNLRVTGVAQGRNWVAFSGTAGDVDRAFKTTLHRYQVRGVNHYANAQDPSIPIALDVVVSGVRGLNDFKLKPRSAVKKRAGSVLEVDPKYNSSGGTHYLSPDDVATIYNLRPLYSSGITGAGQKIVIPGQTQIDLADLQKFRSKFNLPGSDPDVILVPGTRDPGKNLDDMGEADLDLQWSMAAAPNVKQIYVYSYDVMDAVKYAIDQNLAPVISLSYGLCEAQTSNSEAALERSWARQAIAQGMTWFSASGDSGGADCVTSTSTSYGGLAVDFPGSIPEVTSVGGTSFNEGAGNYWSATANANGGSALSYIPEVVWNDSLTNDPSSGGGGASTIFPKPTWQTGPGVPADNARDVPDIALASSADHDGYLVYSNAKLEVYGGTSVASPVMAGITVLLNQYLTSVGAQSSPGLGNINPKLYSLAQTAPAAFHDITSGHNIVKVTCSTRSRTCVSGSYGFNAGPGYDQATGLGSVDAYALISAWHGATGSVSKGSTNTSVSLSAASVSWAQSVTITASVQTSNGGVATGTVTFSAGALGLGTATLNNGTASLTVNAASLASGINNITVSYGGDGAYSASTAAVALSVSAASTGTPAITSIANGASFKTSFAPGMAISIFGSQLAPAEWIASAVPLATNAVGVSVTVNGTLAPLYYVSPTQINAQVPYEVVPGTTAVVTVNNNGRTAFTYLTLASAAPGIFTNGSNQVVPASTIGRGANLTLFFTGAGAVSPYIGTGVAPASSTSVENLPVPLQTVRVTVGGSICPVSFAGIPQSLVGVAQINCTVPSSVGAGAQDVVITVGGLTSAPATVYVTQ